MTFRENITEHVTDILFIPFENTKMLLYPGRVLNSCSFDYRAKIDKVSQEGRIKDGFPYLQSYKGPFNFKGFAFCKVSQKKNNSNEDSFEEDYISGVLETLKSCRKIQNTSFDRVLIGYSKKYGSAYKIIKALMSELCTSKYENQPFKKVVVTAETSFDFVELSLGFSKNMNDFANENML